MPKIRSVVALPVLALVGCTLAPHYESPPPPVAKEWPAQGPVYTAGTSATADLGWRDFFGDPRLQALIELALANNRDLRVATLNVDHLRALYRVQRAELLPNIDATGSDTRSRVPASISPYGFGYTGSVYNVGLSLNAYELDLFGRVRSLRDAALEQYFSGEEAQRSAQLVLIANVANQYVTECAYDEQRAIAEQTLESNRTTLELTKHRYEVGSASELDLRTAETEVQTARADLASFAQLRAQAFNALVLLVGCPLPDNLPPPQPLARDSLIEDLPAGLPSDLLVRRPDVREAEHDLKAANASIGAARAAFFPSIVLTASGGASSAQLDQLFKPGSGAWAFAPAVTLPIFAGGANRANLEAAKVEKQIEIALYEKAIETAFREVADEIVARSSVVEELEAQTARLAAEERRYALSKQRYEQGIDSYIVLLTSERDLYTAQQLLVQAQQARLTNLINLYKALGGGWSEHTVAAAPRTAERSVASRGPG